MPSTANTAQEHLRELQALVQDSFKQWHLASNTAAATSLAGMSNPNRIANELHPLGPVQVGILQKEYKEKIAAIRAICYSFAQGPLHQSINGGEPSLAQQFRKYSTILKEATLLEEGLSAVKASMKQCQNTLRAASQDGEIKKDHLLSTVREMATGLGLECYLETAEKPAISPLPISTLTIGGFVIVVDIEVESTGAILKVKVIYDAEVHQDDRALATLDSFHKQYADNKIDFFHNIRSMGVDINELFRREMLITNNDLKKVFMQGHGIPFTHAALPGPSVAYWAPKSDLLDISWDELTVAVEQGANEKVKIPFHRVSISMEGSLASTSGYLPNTRSGFLLSEEETMTLNSVPYGTIMTDQGSVSTTTILRHPLRWVVPNPEPTIEAAFVGILQPPVVVCEEVAKQLAALSKQAGLNATMGNHKDPGYLSLQELLINQNIEQSQWEVVLDQGPSATRQMYSFDRTKNEARLVHRIPFTHISQVYMCTKSCFNEIQHADGTTKRQMNILPGMDSSLEVSIVIQTPQPPRTILASFLNPYTESHMVIEIHVDAGTGQPSVQLIVNKSQMNSNRGGIVNGDVNSGQQGFMAMQMDGVEGSLHQQPSPSLPQQQQQDMRGRAAEGQQGEFSIESSQLTQVLGMSDNIPILVRWVLKRSLAWMKDRHQYQQYSTTGGANNGGASVVGGGGQRNSVGQQYPLSSSVGSNQPLRRVSGNNNADEGGILKRTRI
ncbi:hypothetical protein BG004_001753 [Podila humilis]|nr:hypothetical protein BG004_001753 [Podila humilis]